VNGIVLLNKPPGVTSFQALAGLKRALGTKKIGHAGTLDKFAQGLLITAAGNCTRLIRLFTAQEKEYRAVAVFGQGTDTLDPEGTPTGTGPVPQRADLEAVLGRFRGTIQQRPPEYSAVSVGGVRAYRLARAGQEVELAERAVMINELVLEDYAPPRARLRIVCSKGTYIRSLARDIAEALGTRAYLESLMRNRIGPFSVTEAISPDAFDPARHVLEPGDCLARLPGMGRATLVPGGEERVVSGKTLTRELFTAELEEGWNGVFTAPGELIAIVDRTSGILSYVMVLKSR
jgi:tRNA pseudouridine55 synthase